MGKILDDFRNWRSLTTRMNFQESKSQISGFLDWLDSNEITKAILTEIEDNDKVVEILKKAAFNIPPEISNPMERFQIGLYFMRQAKLGKNLWGLAQKYGIMPSVYTTNVQNIQDEIVDRYIEPVIDYIQDRIIEKTEAADNMASTSPSQADPKKIFVIHGRNEKARDAMFAFLRAIELQPLEWEQAVALTSASSPYIGEVLENAFHTVQAIVVLLTGDDEARLREEFQRETDEDYEKTLTPQARPNVLFEAGLAFGIHPVRVVLVELGQIRPFSDVVGRHTIRISNNITTRQALANRLRTAGCEVNIMGTDWHKAGDFDSAVIPFIEKKKKSTPRVMGKPDDRLFHFRVQQLVTSGGKKDKPKHLFNQEWSAYNRIAESLELGKRFQLEGITISGFEINNGFVSLNILRSLIPASTTTLELGNAMKVEKYWNYFKSQVSVEDITAQLKVLDIHQQ